MTPEELIDCEHFTFDVTKEDIEKAVPGNGSECPIARAVNRTLGLSLGASSVGDDTFCVSVRKNDHPFLYLDNYWTVVFEQPEEASIFISKFDGGLDVEPSTFTARRITE